MCLIPAKTETKSKSVDCKNYRTAHKRNCTRSVTPATSRNIHPKLFLISTHFFFSPQTFVHDFQPIVEWWGSNSSTNSEAAVREGKVLRGSKRERSVRKKQVRQAGLRLVKSSLSQLTLVAAVVGSATYRPKVSSYIMLWWFLERALYSPP